MDATRAGSCHELVQTLNIMCEFYNTPSGDVMIVSDDTSIVYGSQMFDITNQIIEIMKRDYPQAYDALYNLYRRSEANRPYHKYRIAHRFVRCNCGAYDTLSEDLTNGGFNPEQVSCPLRGECDLEGIVCMTTKKSDMLSQRQLQIVAFLAEGLSAQDIASHLNISINTVQNTIQHVKSKLGLTKNTQLVYWYFINILKK